MTEESLMAWGRAFLVGACSAVMMMWFIDVFAMLGATSFSFETYVGSALRGTTSIATRNWLVGFLANLVIGGLFGLLYGYFFETVFRRASVKSGLKVGLIHTVIAAVAFFPFFNIAHEELGTGVQDGFGFLGSGLSAVTPILILVGHLIFGASMGALYGPVRAERVRARFTEPVDASERRAA